MLIMMRPTYTLEVRIQDEPGAKLRANEIADIIQNALALSCPNGTNARVRLVRYEESV